MGGNDSQKFLPWRGIALLSGAQQTSGYCRINTVAQRQSAPARLFQRCALGAAVAGQSPGLQRLDRVTADLPVDRPMYPPFDHSGWPKCMNGARIQFDSRIWSRLCRPSVLVR